MKRTLIALFTAAILVAACGGDDSGDVDAATTGSPGTTDGTGGGGGDGGGDEALDVCSMLDDADVEAVLGEPATAVDGSTGTLYACQWEGESDPLNVLSVSIYVHPDAATAEEQYLATKEGLGGVDITGLGDDASYSDAFGLEVLAGRYDISIDNTGPDEKQGDLDLAQVILEQLQT